MTLRVIPLLTVAAMVSVPSTSLLAQAPTVSLPAGSATSEGPVSTSVPSDTPLVTPPVVAAADTERYALIVTNNRSLSLGRPDLHFADDDGARYARLFGQLFGHGNVVLLTEFDAASAQLFADLPARTTARAPTRANLMSAVSRLAQRVARAKQSGAAVEIHLVFAGHGDVERGQGFIELGDSRLMAADLDTHVIRPLQRADRLHLILDSCNSYFMLNPRKPGGRRWATSTATTQTLLEKYDNVGALISTSAEAVTYEWSEIQSGIFSHEVRSGMRGAADVDADGTITYDELRAFVEVANLSIVNDLYRPKMLANAPAGDNTFLRLPKSSSMLRLSAAPTHRRLTLRDATGVRIIDTHVAAGSGLSVLLPKATSIDVEHRTTAPDGRAVSNVLHVPAVQATAAVSLGDLPAAAQTTQARGQSPLFAALFATPFGPAAYAAQRQSWSQSNEPAHYGVSDRDFTRLSEHLRLVAGLEGAQRVQGGVVMIGFGAGLASSGGLVLDTNAGALDPQVHDAVGYTLLGSGLVLAGSGVVALLTTTKSEDVLTDFLAFEPTTEAERAAHVVAFEGRLEQLANDAEDNRVLVALTTLAAGGLLLTAGSLLLDVDGSAQDTTIIGSLALGGAISAMGLGTYLLFWGKSDAERAWEAYEAQLEREGVIGGVEVVPTIGLTPNGKGGMIGAVGRF